MNEQQRQARLAVDGARRDLRWELREAIERLTVLHEKVSALTDECGWGDLESMKVSRYRSVYASELEWLEAAIQEREEADDAAEQEAAR